MAIIIPSKNIYSIDRPIVLENKINNVSVEQKVVKQDNDYEVSVYNEKISTTNIIVGETISDMEGYIGVVSGTVNTWEAVAYIEVIPSFIVGKKIKIPKLQKHKYIDYLYLGKNEQKEYNIKMTINYALYEGKATAKYKGTYEGGEIKEINKVYPNKPQSSISKQFPHITKEELTNTVENVDVLTSISASVYDKLYEKYPNWVEDISGETNYDNNTEDDTFNFELSFLAGYEKVSLGGRSNLNVEGFWDVEGTCEKYEATQIEITIYGNTIGIDLTDGSVTYGDGDKPFSLEGNELMQNEARANNKVLTKHLASNVLEQYANGKEKATLRCDFANYYDEEGNKVISIDENGFPMGFNVGDEVIPMVYVNSEKDLYMSAKNGQPKIFEVASVRPYFDGASWQEIEIVEKNL